MNEIPAFNGLNIVKTLGTKIKIEGKTFYHF